MNRDTVHRGWLRVQSLFRRHDYSIPATVEEINEPSNKKTHLLSLVSVLSRRQSQSQCKSEANDNVTPLEQRSSADEIEDGDQSTSSKHSWIDGVYLCAKGSALLLLINLVFIATAAGLASKYPDQRGFASGSVIYEGSCVLTKRWSAALHLIINILSTCILGASNYCMQTLAAPSREDIDKFHAQRRWLDIGRTSLRNLLAMGRYRLTLWFILLITTTPFHLL